MKFSFLMEILAFHKMEEINIHSKLLEIFPTCEWRDDKSLFNRVEE